MSAIVLLGLSAALGGSAWAWYSGHLKVAPPAKPEPATYGATAANEPSNDAIENTQAAEESPVVVQPDAAVAKVTADAATAEVAPAAPVAVVVDAAVAAAAPVAADAPVPAESWLVGDGGLYEITEQDLAAADLELDNPTDSEAPAPVNEQSSVSSIADVRKLIAQGKVDEAIAGVRSLRRKDPKNPELPYMLGDLYFEKHFYKDGLSRYREALKLRPGFKARASVQRNAIAALGSDKTYARARALIVRDLGPSALSRLKIAQKRDPSKVVRQRAKSIVAQLTTTRKKRPGYWF